MCVCVCLVRGLMVWGLWAGVWAGVRMGAGVWVCGLWWGGEKGGGWYPDVLTSWGLCGCVRHDARPSVHGSVFRLRLCVVEGGE